MVEESWVHIDPCEAAYNDKKMYVGWGKKHTYVVAFEGCGGEEIVFEDVTEQYAGTPPRAHTHTPHTTHAHMNRTHMNHAYVVAVEVCGSKGTWS